MDTPVTSVRLRNAVGVVLLVLLLAGGAVWWVERRRTRAELEAGLRSSEIVSATFARTNQLKVAELTGTVRAQSSAPILWGMSTATQSTRAPFSVTYFVDLARVNRAAMRWNADARTLWVEVPDVIVAKPAIDMAAADAPDTRGVFVSRATGAALMRAGAGRLAARADAEAHTGANLLQAREAARTAIAQNVAAPLRAAGYGDVTVNVRIAGEPAASGAASEEWDVSRSIAEVYGDLVD